MGKSNINNTNTADTKKTKAVLNKNLGVYTFIDEDGNVTQIKKEKKNKKKYYPNEPTKVDEVIGEIYVIGVSESIPMGVGDNVEAYAKYN